jgi:ABC-type transport system involved in multi-copper enzyme maturation permease subunit
VIATVTTGAVLYFLRGDTIRMLTGNNGQFIHFVDGVLPLSVIWFDKIAFIVSLLVGSQVVAGDLHSGAFTFYFARSVRPRDYVVGKLAGLMILLAGILVVGPVLLAGLRIGLSDRDQLIATLPVLPKMLAIGTLATVVYATIPLGFSALTSNPRTALAMWAAYNILIGSIIALVGRAISPSISALDAPTALQAVALDLFDVEQRITERSHIPLGVAIGSIVVQAALALALVGWRVRRAQQTGVGGS